MSAVAKETRPYNKSEVLLPQLTTVELNNLLKLLPHLSEKEQQDIFNDLTTYEELLTKETAQSDFIEFVKLMWPEFILGRHHEIIADAFERVLRGECKRLIINMPPRHTKSEFASYLLPA